jgi:hypothetical protein
MLATKEMARKVVAGELSIDLNRAEPGLPDDVGYRRSRNPRTASESLDGTTMGDTAAYSGLLRCNNQWSAKDTFAVRWPLCPAENEQAQVTGFNESVEETVSDSCTRSAHHNLSVINHREISEK